MGGGIELNHPEFAFVVSFEHGFPFVGQDAVLHVHAVDEVHRQVHGPFHFAQLQAHVVLNVFHRLVEIELLVGVALEDADGRSQGVGALFNDLVLGFFKPTLISVSLMM